MKYIVVRVGFAAWWGYVYTNSVIEWKHLDRVTGALRGESIGQRWIPLEVGGRDGVGFGGSGWVGMGCGGLKKEHRLSKGSLTGIDPSLKSHDASDKYPTMHHFCTFLLQNGALRDMGLVHCETRPTAGPVLSMRVDSMWPSVLINFLLYCFGCSLSS